MVSPGLRERKKERTRRHIADTAARLFAERGFEQVAVTDVARAAEVAEQTVYNYFPTKEHLVTDREGQIQDRLCELIRSRPPGTCPFGTDRVAPAGSGDDRGPGGRYFSGPQQPRCPPPASPAAGRAAPSSRLSRRAW